jgi:prepilin-type N-terminal cleavage/methylation domain-containing protein
MKKAFSLIELSIVILIIGILIAGVTQSSRLIGAMRLASARSITQSAPVSSMKDLAIWLEATSENSLLDAETENLAFVTTWKDINPTSINKYNLNAPATNNQPRYVSSCINSLPCLRFDGTDDYLSNLSAPITGTELTMFVVAKRISNKAAAAVISGSLASVANDYSDTESFVGFYEEVTGNTLQSFRNGALSTATHPGNDVAYIASATYNNINNITYLNGTAQTTSASTGSFNSTRLLIAGRWTSSSATNFYNGNISEIIFFTRALKAEERKAVESYLGKKWNIKVTP